MRIFRNEILGRIVSQIRQGLGALAVGVASADMVFKIFEIGDVFALGAIQHAFQFL